MAKDYLFEIGTEEMPAHVVPRSVNQLADRTRKFLKENGLKFKDIKTFSTPRRLTILVEDLAEKQDDIDEVKKGPAKKIAQEDMQGAAAAFKLWNQAKGKVMQGLINRRQAEVNLFLSVKG